MQLKLSRNVIILLFFCLASSALRSQTEGPKPPVVTDYKNDTSYTNYNSLRFNVARAQIKSLKNGGAILVRLKTNSNTITKLKAVGNMDLATQLERETALTNKIVIASYLKELTFCPVYFFYSNYSDSVKNKKLAGILVDSDLQINPSIVCNANFYLIAESGQVYNSSLGIVPESEAAKSIERGTPSREVEIVIKNRYFIQLHKPFPYFQIRRSAQISADEKQQAADIDINQLNVQIKKMLKNSENAKQIIGLQRCVRAFNLNLNNFYEKNSSYIISPEIKEFVY